ncbi:MAG TPA: glucuronyl hydrolase [Porphyromonadaceae bacterium]|nr:glucuronyl hydrolase [Porphyromonadaceae bacterium]
MKFIAAVVLSVVLFSCGGVSEKAEKDFVEDNIAFACTQIGKSIDVIEASGKVLNPVTLKADGSVYYCEYTDWRSGFFPGSVWYLYELTRNESLLPLARKYTKAIEEAKNLNWHHDVGFIVYCSFGNGLRITGDADYKEVILQAAKSLSARFRPVAGIIQSWDVVRGWQSERGWECPVIIDNMMNLELLFEATRLSGDSSFYQIAVSHADRTLAEHFRPDGSCYHVIDYSLVDGSVRNRHTAQGYAHTSAWSRGQAWAIYGYVVAYRETGDEKYLDQAVKTFEFMKNHRNRPDDLIPYWDMDAPNIPNEPRDVSSAACMASALYELSTMPVSDPLSYKSYADRIMESLASSAYRAEPGTNGNFILMHSVGSIPHNAEVDKPLNYADYYFIEALKRKKEIEMNKLKTD